MRLFVAAEISAEMRQAAVHAAETIRRKIGRGIDAHWVEPEKMHLTVRFIGHVDDERVPDLLGILGEPVRVAPFEIALGASGVFPSRGGPRVIWIGLTAGVPSLAAIHDEFDRRLAPLGFDVDDRPYSAHLTLARVKRIRSGSAAAIRATIERASVDPGRGRVDRVTVFRSHMSSQGSRYEPIVYSRLQR